MSDTLSTSEPTTEATASASALAADTDAATLAALDAGEFQGHSYHADKTKIMARLKRIEGQIRGISRMVEEDRYCIDVLTQVSAVMASTRAVGMLVLEDHIRGCVMNADPDHREETMNELNLAIERFVRSVGN